MCLVFARPKDSRADNHIAWFFENARLFFVWASREIGSPLLFLKDSKIAEERGTLYCCLSGQSPHCT